MKLEKTNRGFQIIHFTDQYRVKCSLQESSLATEAAIWLGCDDASPRKLGKNGWEDIKMPDEYISNTRMHLTQQQVKDLLPHLLEFVLNGNLG